MNAFYETMPWGNNLLASWNKSISEIRGTYPIAFVRREIYAEPEPMFVPEFVRRQQQPLQITQPKEEKIDPNKVGTVPIPQALKETTENLVSDAKSLLVQIALLLLAVVLVGVGVYGLVR